MAALANIAHGCNSHKTKIALKLGNTVTEAGFEQILSQVH